MASRHLSRSIALQTLYEWDFRDKNEEKLDAVIEKAAKDAAEGVRPIIEQSLAVIAGRLHILETRIAVLERKLRIRIVK